MTVSADKATLRVEFGAKRKALTGSEMQQMQEQIAAQAAKLTLPASGIWMLFKPMSHHNEIDPLLLADSVLETVGQKQYCYPVITAEGIMNARLVNESTQWTNNEWQIPEPQNGEWVAPDKISVMVVPLVAFDKRGYRVGFGKGYYDRYIARCNRNLITVGLSYFEAAHEITNVMPFDKPLRYCITPAQVYEF